MYRVRFDILDEFLKELSESRSMLTGPLRVCATLEPFGQHHQLKLRLQAGILTAVAGSTGRAIIPVLVELMADCGELIPDEAAVEHNKPAQEALQSMQAKLQEWADKAARPVQGGRYV